MTAHTSVEPDEYWRRARAELDGLPDGGLNIAHEALDRWVAAGAGALVALRWLPKRDDPVDLTYDELTRRTNRFARALRSLGHGRGVCVASLAGRIPDVHVTALGTLRAGGVFSPLFSAFGPEPIAQRISIGSIAVLVTTPSLFRRKIAPILDELTSVQTVLVTGDDPELPDDPRVHSLAACMAAESDEPIVAPTRPDELALVHFTSGTTGQPKGAMHVHEAVLSHYATGRDVLDLRPGDRFWCTADPGWVTGTSYGIIAPLVNGTTCIVDEADFDAERWYTIVQDERIDVWYTAPTAIRMLMRAGDELAAGHDFSRLRLVASVGEPLNPEAVLWAERAFGVPVLDNWWQTETGGIMIANTRAEPVRPGSMGIPIPGIEAGVLARGDDEELVVGPDGEPELERRPDHSGELALRRGWPSMFRGYLDQDERYRSSFCGNWYRTGDLARCDEDGYYWFVGRTDDVIKSAGHLIGPFEVESALVEHPAVAEAGVIGKPDDTAGAIVKAFVALAPGHIDDDELRRELIGHARSRLGPAVAPREIEVLDGLPHTRSGKIMRRLLKARELGLDEGDTSTLET